MQFNSSEREIVLKVVYCGPPGSGKSTNLEQVHRLLEPHVCSRLATLSNGTDRTLSFDIVPPLRAPGYRIKLRIFTVAGEAVQASTRRVAMAGADGIVFVADSQRDRETANTEHWDQMLQTARATGADTASLPIVIQFNKRDLPAALSEEELAAAKRTHQERSFSATAARGEGVLETLHGLLELLFDQLEQRYNFEKKFNLSGEDFLDEVFANAMRQ